MRDGDRSSLSEDEHGDDGRCVRIRSQILVVVLAWPSISAFRLAPPAASSTLAPFDLSWPLKCEVPTRTLLLRLSSASSGVSLFLVQQSPSFAHRRLSRHSPTSNDRERQQGQQLA